MAQLCHLQFPFFDPKSRNWVLYHRIKCIKWSLICKVTILQQISELPKMETTTHHLRPRLEPTTTLVKNSDSTWEESLSHYGQSTLEIRTHCPAQRLR